MEMVLGSRARTISARPLHQERNNRRGWSAGFTLIEVLIAAVLFLVVALGVLPLFQQAIRTNTAGQDSTDVSNLARSRVEEFMQIPYDSPLLQVTAGTENVIEDYYDRATEEWIDGTPPDPTAADWLRTTTIRWYNVSAVRGDDGDTADLGDDVQTGIVNRDEALPAGTPPQDVHFKEIEVELTGTSGGGIVGPGKRIVVRALRSQ